MQQKDPIGAKSVLTFIVTLADTEIKTYFGRVYSPHFWRLHPNA